MTAQETDEQLIQRACERFGLDPALKPCYIARSGKRRALLSAAGYDMVAFKTGDYLGADAVEFGPDKILVKPLITALDGLFVPEYARQTVYRNTSNGTATFTATIYAQEYINDVSRVRNIHMFMSKWVHCVAMRLAFTDVLGSEVALEELDAQMDFTKGATGVVELQKMNAQGAILVHDTIATPGELVTIRHPAPPSCRQFYGAQDVDMLIAECFK